MSQSNNNNSGSNNHIDTELEHQSQTTQMNVEFVEQQPLVTEDARLGTSAPPSAAMESQMPEDTWMAAKQLSKPVVIQRFDWGVDAAAGTTLVNFRFPDILTTLDNMHRETLKMYTFFKMNFRLRFQINGTKFHSGQLIVSWDPFSQANDPLNAEYRPFNIVYATGLPNTLLNASANEPTEITIPFVHPRNFLTTNSGAGFDDLGTVRVSVMNPLRAAEGATQKLSIIIWLYADSPSVHVPIYTHTLKIPNERVVPTSGLISSLLGDKVGGFIDDVGDTFGNFATGNFGGALKGAGKSLTGLAGLLGLDYPSRPIIEQSNINPLGPMSPGKGVDSSYRLGTDPRGGHVATVDQTASTVNECDLEHIKTVPMLFRQIQWADSKATGSILTFFPVTPNICAVENGVASNTYLSWLSNAFAFFRGSLQYKVEWVSTQFHTGRVLVAFIPNQFDTNPTLENAYSCPNAVIDIQQNSVCTITVPFISPTPYKRTNITSTAALDDQVIGYVYFFVLNPLVRPSNVTDTIEFNLYISGGPDFQFAVPKASFIEPYREVTATSEEVIPTIGRMETRTGGNQEPPSISVTFGSPLVPPIDMFGEEFPLCDYMKRYGLLSQHNINIPEIAQYSVFSEGNYPSTLRDGAGAPETGPIAGQVQLTPLSTITSMFACWFGSLRYKLATDFNRASSTSMTVTYDPLDTSDLIATFSGGGYPIQRTNLSQNSALEVELPCYTNYNLLLTAPVATTGGSDVAAAGALHANIQGPSGTLGRLDIYQAAGDDFRPFYLISPPADFAAPANYHYGRVLRS